MQSAASSLSELAVLALALSMLIRWFDHLKATREQTTQQSNESTPENEAIQNKRALIPKP